jgi:hypothetical protein
MAKRELTKDEIEQVRQYVSERETGAYPDYSISVVSASPRFCRECMPDDMSLWAMMETRMAILNARASAARSVWTARP